MVFIMISGIITIIIGGYLGFKLVTEDLIDKNSIPYKWAYEINFIITLLVIVGIVTAGISTIIFYYS